VPLTNTFILLTSGATVTWAHHAVLARSKKQTIIALILTLVLAILFTCLQGLEYFSSPFNISDGVYGSVFYMSTGFHGFHVVRAHYKQRVFFLKKIVRMFLYV
jgi:cytochrome c oxidase subunit 3